MSQNASDYIPVCLPNEPARTRIREALNFLSRRCDHAHQRDGHGFNKYDSPHGKEWAAAFESGGVASLEPFKLKAAHRMLQKYHRQLAEGGIELPTEAQLENELRSVVAGIHKQSPPTTEKQSLEMRNAENAIPGYQTVCILEQSPVHSANLTGSLCLTGSQLYYDHLKKHKKGCNEIIVHEVMVLDAEDHQITFRLAKKIPEVDAVSIRRINSDVVWNVDRDFSINEYDVDHNILLVTILSEQVFETIVNSKIEDLRIATDLLFLVQRVLDWYHEFGHSVALPKTAPVPIDMAKIPILDGAHPSSEQQNALELLLDEPFSYVWGAPGTGKTQLVLAYAIIGLLNNRKRIAIFAPTNNSLEQVLRGVLTMTDKAEIDRSRIMRIGSPSRAFAHDFPELCESRAISKHTLEIDSLISKISSCIELRTGEEQKRKSTSQLMSMVIDEYEEMDLRTLKAKRKRLREMKRSIRKSKLHDRLLNAEIIAATLDGYIGRLVKEKIPFDHIFIDEAGYASVVKALPAISIGCPVTLLGDHLQLPPVCEVGDDEMRAHSHIQDTFVWAQSAIHAESLCRYSAEDAFQAYINNDMPLFDSLKPVSLTRTFRFGTNLAAVLDEYVYKIGFSGAVDGTTELLFIDAPGEQPQPSHPSTRKASRENLAEAEAIKRWIKIEQPQDAIILAPYTVQVRLLGDMLPEYRRDQKILTVHGSQGREWDDVILSVVDTDRLWFTDSRNKRSRGLNLINTAVSRAKKRLVIVCNKSWWLERRGQLIRALLLAGEDATQNLY